MISWGEMAGLRGNDFFSAYFGVLVGYGGGMIAFGYKHKAGQYGYRITRLFDEFTFSTSTRLTDGRTHSYLSLRQRVRRS